jgi:UDP-N-acetylmuramate-alanine ligase
MVAWLNELPPNGFAVLCSDDPGVCAILPKLRCRYFTYGFNESADYRLIACQQIGLRTSLCWESPDGIRHEDQIHLPGRHNALNGLAAWIATTHFVEGGNPDLTPSWASYPGVNRRMMLHGELALDEGSALLIEDYGHHPTEMKATFNAIQAAWPEKRLVVLFQPHRYTRTRDLLSDFVEVLRLVPNLYLLPIYAAGEQAIQGVSSEHLAKIIEEQSNQLPIVYTDLNQARNALQSMLRENDILLLQGAGDVGSLVQRLGVLE